MNKNNSLVIINYLVFCKAKEDGMNGFSDILLEALHNLGYDVKNIDGRLYLVKLEKSNNRDGGHE